MERVFNFSAGPAALPLPVLERARDELTSWHGCGMSVMELSHRGKEFMSIAERAEADLRKLLDIPDGYRVLFLQGGATAQFGAVPFNLAGPGDKADYVVTGSWSKEGAGRGPALPARAGGGGRRGNRHTAHSRSGRLALSPDAAYLHYTPNETIGGVEFHFVPEATAPAGGRHVLDDPVAPARRQPLRADLCRRAEEHRPGRAGDRHRPRGPARPAREGTPAMMDYREQAENGSMLNTPPTWAWYVAGLVFEWLLEQGGLAEMERRNRRKAETLYGAIDGSDFYANPVDQACRSWMNVPFTLPIRRWMRSSSSRRRRPDSGDAEGTSLGRRHAREPVQRHAAGRRGCAGRFHAASSSAAADNPPVALRHKSATIGRITRRRWRSQ
jgi:phosphoserine aminotransferase